MAYLWGKIRRGEAVNYQSYEPLKEAIEKKLMSSVREMSRIITKARTRDEEQLGKYRDLVGALLERGYNEHSAEVVLKYAANNLWKD
jgi:serine protein kinase